MDAPVHDALHDVEARTGVLYDGSLPCRVCLLIQAARADERKQLLAKAQAAYIRAVPSRQGRMSAEEKARVAAAVQMIRFIRGEA